MKRSHWSSGLLALSLLASAGFAQQGAAPAQPEKKPAEKQPDKKPESKPEAKPAAEPEMAPEMAEWAMLGKTGPMHDRLKKGAGAWDAKVKSWMNPSDPNPTESTSKANIAMMFEGRFARMDYSGDFMGKPFKGFGLYGYDNATKKFQSVWIDSSSTNMMISTGELSADEKTINWTGSFAGPGGKTIKTRQTDTIIDDDHTVFTMYMTEEGGTEQKAMEITYTRIKKDAPEVRKLRPVTAEPAPKPGKSAPPASTPAPPTSPKEEPKSPK